MSSEIQIAKLISIQVGKPRDLGTFGSVDPLDRPWRSAIIKLPISGAVRARREGLEGDGQADRRHHGGFDKAILAYSASHYPAWRQELGLSDADFEHGAFGENLTIEGMDEAAVCIGDVFEVGGEVRIEVSQPRQPCMNLSRRWRRADMMNRVKESGRTGWYLRVLREGALEAGMEMRLVDRLHPDWTVARATDVMMNRTLIPEDAISLAELPELSITWKETLAGG